MGKKNRNCHFTLPLHLPFFQTVHVEWGAAAGSLSLWGGFVSFSVFAAAPYIFCFCFAYLLNIFLSFAFFFPFERVHDPGEDPGVKGSLWRGWLG